MRPAPDPWGPSAEHCPMLTGGGGAVGAHLRYNPAGRGRSNTSTAAYKEFRHDGPSHLHPQARGRDCGLAIASSGARPNRNWRSECCPRAWTVRRRIVLVRGDRTVASGGAQRHGRAEPFDDVGRGSGFDAAGAGAAGWADRLSWTFL